MNVRTEDMNGKIKKVIYLILDCFSKIENQLENSFKDSVKCGNCSEKNDIIVEVGNQLFIDCDLTNGCIEDLPLTLNLSKKLLLQ